MITNVNNLYLKQILDHLALHKGVGHTEAIICGLENVDFPVRCITSCNNASQILEARIANPLVTYTFPGIFMQLPKKPDPVIVVDHSALHVLFSQVLDILSLQK